VKTSEALRLDWCHEGLYTWHHDGLWERWTGTCLCVLTRNKQQTVKNDSGRSLTTT